MRLQRSKYISFFILIILFITSCWSDEFTKAKEDEFIFNQEIIFEKENSEYTLLIRDSGKKKPLRWYGREQCSKYRTVRYHGDTSFYVAFRLKNIFSTFGSIAIKDIEVNSKKWQRTNFYIYFENKDSLSWDESRMIILNAITESCDLKLDTNFKRVELNSINIFDETLLHKKITNHFDEPSEMQISDTLLIIKNTSLEYIANYIDEISKYRYQYIGSDTNKYSFNISLKSINYIDKFNDKYKDLGISLISGYEEVSHFVIKDRN